MERKIVDLLAPVAAAAVTRLYMAVPRRFPAVPGTIGGEIAPAVVAAGLMAEAGEGCTHCAVCEVASHESQITLRGNCRYDRRT